MVGCAEPKELRGVMRITIEQLSAAGACLEALDSFHTLFGESVEVTEELCTKHAQDFDWKWAAKLLTLAQGARYATVIAPARAECDRVCAPARAECDRVCAPARAEYDRVCAPARAEYGRVCACAWARAYNRDDLGGTKSERHCS